MLRILCVSLVLVFAGETLHAEPMNFVVILVDDLGQKDIGIEGSTFYETPNIDRLAAGGMRFTNGYATCEVCSPSRASIMLGKYRPRIGITDWIGVATGRNWNEMTESFLRSTGFVAAQRRHYRRGVA